MRCPVTLAQLACSPVFAALPAAALEQLAAGARRRAYQRGQTLVYQGDFAVAAYLIASGRVKAVRSLREGEDVLLRILGVGALIGELALLDDQLCSDTIVALEDTVVYILERSVFLACLHDHPAAARQLIRTLVGRIRRLETQVAELALLDVPQRLADKLLELAALYGQPGPQGICLDLCLTQSEWASMLGTSRSMVNLGLRSLERRGVIVRDGQRIVLRRPEVLEPAHDGIAGEIIRSA